MPEKHVYTEIDSFERITVAEKWAFGVGACAGLIGGMAVTVGNVSYTNVELQMYDVRSKLNALLTVETDAKNAKPEVQQYFFKRESYYDHKLQTLQTKLDNRPSQHHQLEKIGGITIGAAALVLAGCMAVRYGVHRSRNAIKARKDRQAWDEHVEASVRDFREKMDFRTSIDRPFDQ